MTYQWFTRCTCPIKWKPSKDIHIHPFTFLIKYKAKIIYLHFCYSFWAFRFPLSFCNSVRAGHLNTVQQGETLTIVANVKQSHCILGSTGAELIVFRIVFMHLCYPCQTRLTVLSQLWSGPSVYSNRIHQPKGLTVLLKASFQHHVKVIVIQSFILLLYIPFFFLLLSNTWEPCCFPISFHFHFHFIPPFVEKALLTLIENIIEMFLFQLFVLYFLLTIHYFPVVSTSSLYILIHIFFVLHHNLNGTKTLPGILWKAWGKVTLLADTYLFTGFPVIN